MFHREEDEEEDERDVLCQKDPIIDVVVNAVFSEIGLNLSEAVDKNDDKIQAHCDERNIFDQTGLEKVLLAPEDGY